MNIDSVFPRNCPFEYWTPVVNGTTITYVKSRDDMGLLVSFTGGTLTLITDTQMAEGSVIRGLQDAAGNDIQVVDGNAYDLYVQSATPSLDPWSQIVGWRHTLRNTAPRDFEAALLAIAGA